MKKYVTIVLLSLFVALLGMYLYIEEQNKAETATYLETGDFKPKINNVTPSSTLPDLNDNPISFGGQQTTLQLVNFWASWCGPCILEAPDLVKIHENYKDKITLYAVNSTAYDREREARSFIDEHGFKFDVLFDRDGTYTELYKVNTYPTSFVIDQDGVIRERINGVIPYEEWERIIEKWSN